MGGDEPDPAVAGAEGARRRVGHDAGAAAGVLAAHGLDRPAHSERDGGDGREVGGARGRARRGGPGEQEKEDDEQAAGVSHDRQEITPGLRKL